MLTMKIFQPLSKMSNCVFLVHPLVIRAIVLSSDSSMHLSSGIIVSFFFFAPFIKYLIKL